MNHSKNKENYVYKECEIYYSKDDHQSIEVFDMKDSTKATLRHARCFYGTYVPASKSFTSQIALKEDNDKQKGHLTCFYINEQKKIEIIVLRLKNPQIALEIMHSTNSLNWRKRRSDSYDNSGIYFNKFLDLDR